MMTMKNDNGSSGLAVYFFLCGLIASQVWAQSNPVDAQAEPADQYSLVLELTEDGASIARLIDRTMNIEWIEREAELHEIDSPTPLDTRVTVERRTSNEISIALSVHNPTDQPVRTDIRFPILRDLTGGDAETLAYCFPRQDLILGSEPVELEEAYSGRFPLQFVTAYQPGKGGIYLITCDTQMNRKRYFLNKSDDVSMGSVYQDVVIEPGQTITLPPARLGTYQGDWHGAFEAYRHWVAEWYQPIVERKDWFRRVFNFRQVFLYPNLDTPGLFQPQANTLDIARSIDEDIERFGGVDYCHLFDWSQTPDQGRVGMYSPWHVLPRDRFLEELSQVKEREIPVGLYFEGYLVSPAAEIPGRPGREWQLQNASGNRYDPFGSGDDYLCPAVSRWRDHLAQAVVRAEAQTGADGFYLDQFGFGYQYPCFDPTHGHAVPSNQVLEETELVAQVRAALSPEKILYTEQVPVDVAMQFQDGSFSYSLLHARHPGCPSRTNLTRYAFPDFKTIQILRGDGPIGDDVHGVKIAFFHGDGLWLVGPSDNSKWYGPQVMELIKKTHAIKRAYADAFASDRVFPLVPTLQEGLYANHFVGTNREVWTLYNAGSATIDGAVLRIEHAPGDRYVDIWNNKECLFEVRDGQAIISLRMNPGDVGCVMQLRELPR